MKKNIILTAFSLLLLYGCTGDMERIQTGTNPDRNKYGRINLCRRSKDKADFK